MVFSNLYYDKCHNTPTRQSKQIACGRREKRFMVRNYSGKTIAPEDICAEEELLRQTEEKRILVFVRGRAL